MSSSINATTQQLYAYPSKGQSPKQKLPKRSKVFCFRVFASTTVMLNYPLFIAQ